MTKTYKRDQVKKKTANPSLFLTRNNHTHDRVERIFREKDNERKKYKLTSGNVGMAI